MIWLGFIAMCVGMFMAILDIQVVAASLPEIGVALGISEDGLSWIQTAYLTAEVVAIPLTGFLTRALSCKGLFMAATSGFVVTSLACAASYDETTLIMARAAQGFFGGVLIPSVFTAVFTMFPEKRRVLATTIAGVFAMIAPTVGPLVGGWLTEHYSWHWIFLINFAPGILVVLFVARALPAGITNWRLFREIDYPAILLAAIFLSALEIFLKQGPGHHWRGPFIFSTGAVSALALVLTVRRCLTRHDPFLDLARFQDRLFSAGCALSFILGIGLYGSVYLLPIFLGFVRDHSPFEIGSIMVVMGIAQLATAPFAASAETRVDPRLLSALGYGLFAAGILSNGFFDKASDYDAAFWPQILRGAGVMFCILPSTRIALDGWPETVLAEASGLFNLMRNLGGAIGISAIDTILEQRTPFHIERLIARLQAGDPEAAKFVGLPLDRFHNQALGPIDEATRTLVEPLVKSAGFVQACNDAWLAIGVLFALSLLVIAALGRVDRTCILERRSLSKS